MMRAPSFTATITLLCLAASVSAADLRITCNPGFRVVIDGEPAGDCADDVQGVVVESLDAGPHSVLLEGADGPAGEATVVLETADQQIAFFGPAATRPAGAAETSAGGSPGSIEIVTDAPRCWVEINGRRIEKLEPVLTVHSVPAGRRTVWLQELGTLLEVGVTVLPGAPVRLTASFADRTTEVEALEGAADGSGAVPGGCYHYWIEVLQTSSVEKVGKVSEVLDEEGYPIHHQDVVTVHTGEMPLYKLRVGPFANRFSADRTLFKIGARDLPGARVVKEPCR